MDHGSSDRVPASSLILFGSVVFTLTTYVTFKSLWEVAIPVWLLVAVLGLQFAALLLGSSKILTQLGAASLSALIAVAACLGAVFLIFPPLLELQIAGAVGGGSALLFILASFVAASRVDPIPSSAPEPLILGNLEEDHTVELVKYGEVRAPDAADTDDLPLTDASWEEKVPNAETTPKNDVLLPTDEKDFYTFDELSETVIEAALGGQDHFSSSEIKGSDREIAPMRGDENISPEPVVESPSDFDASIEPSVPEDWVEDTARVMGYDAPGNTAAGTFGPAPSGEEVFEEKPVTNEGVPGVKMRTRFKVLDATSGDHFGTFYGDEGYSTLDTTSLTELLSTKLAVGKLSIVKLDWSNFDEVEVHIRMEEIEVVTDAADAPSLDESPEGSMEEIALPNVNLSVPRYMVYDRRTIQPMGEFLPDEDRSRIDRLTLYKMFPEYDFKTFEIDSIRWEADEVRILIRGDKKAQSPKPKAHPPSLTTSDQLRRTRSPKK